MSDINFESHADVDYLVIQNRTIPDIGVDPLKYNDILKLSHAKNVLVENCTITGGVEDCVDANRYCENVLIENTKLRSSGRYCCTIKGGSKNITFRNIEVITHGLSTDIELGAWSDQSDDRTTNVVLDNVWSTDGKPVRVRVWWADAPKIIGGNVKICILPRFVVIIYRWMRKRHLAP